MERFDKTDTFRIHQRDLTEAERMHVKAIKAAAETMQNVLKSDRPDRHCMEIATQKLEECVMWAIKAIGGGMRRD